ncbi:MAG: hypothetical protein LBV40_01835 [Methanomicrobiales archaeon]|jgi:hypothetical protein|nr:hypothetical protein [Methanomicrobiales archaeon]
MKYTYIKAVLLACLALGLCILPASATNNFGSGTAYLYQGQAQVYTVSIDSYAQIYMTPPAGANFDLYALQCQGSYHGCSCPTSSYVMQYATYVSRNGVGTQDVLNLPRGTWCIAVFAKLGSGSYSISEVSSLKPNPTKVPTRVPTAAPPVQPSNPGLYKQDIQYGNAIQGKSTVYTYQIGGGRTAIEWYAQPTSCNAYEPPVIMAASSSISSMRQPYPSCNVDLDLYVYKNCDPRYSRCKALYADTSSGSGAYVGIPYPEIGAKFYVQVYAKRGAAPFRVIARSYTENEAPIVMMSVPDLYTASNVEAPA